MIEFIAGFVAASLIALAYIARSRHVSKWGEGPSPNPETQWLFESAVSDAILRPISTVSPQDETPTLTPTLPEQGFHLHIQDWGPDFTGEDDVLPRYRWTLWFEDHKPRNQISKTDEKVIGLTLPLAIGNEMTLDQAEAEGRAVVMEEYGLASTEIIFEPWKGSSL